MLSCKDMTEHASRHLDGEETWRERILVWLHLAICVHCRRYLQQLRATIGLLAGLSSPPADEASIDAVLASLERGAR
jgi:anti-sigma factor RsiW